LRYEEETADTMRTRLAAMNDVARDLEIGWFRAIAAGEQSPVTDTCRALTGEAPQTLEDYFAAFPDRLGPLRRAGAS
jgi:hypothetical protein